MTARRRRNRKQHVAAGVRFTYAGEIRIPLQMGRHALNQKEPA